MAMPRLFSTTGRPGKGHNLNTLSSLDDYANASSLDPGGCSVCLPRQWVADVHNGNHESIETCLPAHLIALQMSRMHGIKIWPGTLPA